MTFLQSTYLFALAGLIAPIIIHLWSKKNQTPIPFSSTRFIATSPQRALKKILPSDLWLFLLRCLIILFLVALLADGRINSWTQQEKYTYYVDSAYADEPTAVEALLRLSDTATTQWLPNVRPEQRLALWNKLVTTGDVIISPWSPKQNSFSKESFDDLTFLSLPLDVQRHALGAGKVDAQNTEVIASFDMSSISLERQPTEKGPTTVRYYLEANRDFQPQANIVRAALNTLQEKGFYDLDEVTDISRADLLVWLSREEPPPSNAQLIELSEATVPWTEYSKNFATISASLTSKKALQSDLINQLYQWLDPYQSRVVAYDIRSSFALNENSVDFSDTSEQILTELRWLWWTLLIVCIGIERWLALK